MTSPWFLGHYIRINYIKFQKDYAGKTIAFHVDDYSTISHKLLNLDLKISIINIRDGFFIPQVPPLFNGDYNYYFLTNEEYEECKKNIFLHLKKLSGETIQKFENKIEEYEISQLHTFPFEEIEKELYSIIDNMLKEDIFPNNLPDFLALLGSKYLIVLMKKYQQSEFFNNLTASLSTNFDYKSEVTQELLEYLLEVYPKMHSHNIGTFLSDTVYYFPEFKDAVKKLLYDESTDLLDFYYGPLLNVIEEDLPTGLQENIRKSITILLSDELFQIKNKEVYIHRKDYLTQLLKLEKDYLLKPPTKDSYGKYVESMRTMSEKIKDIQIRYSDPDYKVPIKLFFESTLKNSETNYDDKRKILQLLARKEFDLIEELNPVLKNLLEHEMKFIDYPIEKLPYTEEELQKLLHHPSKNVRMLAIEKLKIDLEERSNLLNEFDFIKIYSPILVINERPEFAGELINDLRIKTIIKNFGKNRYIEINSKTRVIKLNYAEFDKLMTTKNLVYYQARDCLEFYTKKNVLDYYLIEDEKKSESKPVVSIQKNKNLKEISDKNANFDMRQNNSGWKEEIFIMRDNYPIAHLEYEGYVMKPRLEIFQIEMDEEDVFNMSGEEFGEIIHDLQETKESQIEKNVSEYFGDLELSKVDKVIIKVKFNFWLH